MYIYIYIYIIYIYYINIIFTYTLFFLISFFLIFYLTTCPELLRNIGNITTLQQIIRKVLSINNNINKQYVNP